MSRVFTILLFGLLLAGCIAQPEHPNIFEDPVCAPPCWENITPGVTTKAEALTILSTLEEIDQPVVDPAPPFIGFDDRIRFTFFKDTHLRGSFYILGDQISMIVFEYRSLITLQRAIDLFGEPQSILVFSAGEINQATFLNSEKGIAFCNRTSFDEDPNISPEDVMNLVIFFDPGQYQLLLDTGLLSSNQLGADEIMSRLLPWGGYGSVYQYRTPIDP